MKTKSSHNWNCKPGTYNYLNDEYLFESSLKFGMPEILKLPQIDPLTKDWQPFHIHKHNDIKPVHFFTDDHFQNRFWKKPDLYIEKLRTCKAVSTPDFSPYWDYPEALQIFNIYRSRYLTRLMQEKGLNVIPYINFNGENTFEYAFCGVPKGMIIAISTIGRCFSISLFRELIDILEPTKIYCHGDKMYKELTFLHPNVSFILTYMQQRGLNKIKSEI